MMMRAILFSTLIFTFVGCKQDQSPKESAPKTPTSTPKIEVKADGLAYVVGDTDPFTGSVKKVDTKGNLLFERPFTAGKRNGIERRFVPGEPPILELEITWKEGEKILHIDYWPNGQKKREGPMRNGVLFGLVQKWYEDGALRFRATYDENFKWHGHAYDRDDDRNLMWDAEFNHGKYVSGHHPADFVPKP
jgi:antitoxin component YwqK of YwqJK toxin-antitoxin module